MHEYRNLEVWRRGHDALLRVYRLSREFSADERFGLTSQLRRAALSVPLNLVEGSKRLSAAEFLRHVNIAEGSAAEAGYAIEVAVELGQVTNAGAAPLIEEYVVIERMLCALRKRVMATTPKRRAKAMSHEP